MVKGKILSGLLALVLFLVLSGCGKNGDSTGKSSKSKASKAETSFSAVSGSGSTSDESSDSAQSAEASGKIVSSKSSEDENTGASSKQITTSSASTSSSSNAKTLYVKNFGAKGDGKTDDGAAILYAISELGNAGKGSTLIFETNKTYFVNDNGMSGLLRYALLLDSLTGVTVKGNNTTILCGSNHGFLKVSSCVNVTVEGFNFDRKIRSHFVGTVISINKNNGTAVFKSDRDIPLTDSYTYSKQAFGLIDKGSTSRSFLCTNKFEVVNKSANEYRVYFDLTDKSLNTGGSYNSLNVGSKVILPTPGVGHMGIDSCNIGGNTDFTLKDCNVWNGTEFVFAVRGNKGTTRFTNVDLVPAPDETVVFCSWRDGFHCKTNKGPIIWENCESKGLGDDIINISANMMYISKKYSNSDVECIWPETGGSYGEVEVGAEVVIWDENTGKLIGRTKIASVVNRTNNRYKLTDSLSGLTTGTNVRFCIQSDVAPGSKVINCDFEGTMRFRGPATIQSSKLRLIKMWIDTHANLEGPIPKDIIFKNCEFIGVPNSGLIISSNSSKTTYTTGLYRLENIRFENCTGLKQSLFSNRLNFVATSVDAITVTPAIS